MAKQFDVKTLRIVFFIIFIVAGFTIGGWLCGKFILTPRLVISSVDIGTFAPGAVVERTVRLDNKGWGGLVIYDVKPCCGIVLPAGFPERLGPRSTAFIVLRIKTPMSYSLLKRKVTLKTNDRIHPILEIAVRGEPDTSVMITPTEVSLGHIVAGDKFSGVAKIQIKNKLEGFWYATSSSPYVQALSHKDTSDGIVSINLDISENMPRGKFKEYLHIRTNLAKNPSITIPISGTVERGLRPRPEKAFFGVVKGEAVVFRCVRLEIICSGWETVEVEPVGFDGLDANLKQEDKDTFKLRLRLDPLKMPLLLDSFISLRNSSGDRIQIPIFAVRKDKLNNSGQTDM